MTTNDTNSESVVLDILKKKLASGRKRSRLIVEIDLDPVPGWGNNAKDHAAFLQQILNNQIPHYNPTVEIVG